MTKEEALIRGIIGPTRCEIRVFARAVSVTSHLLFCEGVAQDDILVMSHIYAEVAHQLDRELSAVSRQIERIGNLCWEHLDAEGKQKYIGRQLKDIRAPRDMLFYLAYYLHFHTPYYEVLERWPELLFGTEEDVPSPSAEIQSSISNI